MSFRGWLSESSLLAIRRTGNFVLLALLLRADTTLRPLHAELLSRNYIEIFRLRKPVQGRVPKKSYEVTLTKFFVLAALPNLAELFIREPSGDDGKRHRQGTKTLRQCLHDGFRPPPSSGLAPSTGSLNPPSSSIWDRISGTASPSRITSSGSTFCRSRIHLAKTLVRAWLRSRASSRMTSAAPIQCWNSSGGLPREPACPACLRGAPPGRKTHRVQAFAAVVKDHQEFIHAPPPTPGARCADQESPSNVASATTCPAPVSRAREYTRTAAA